MFTAQMKTVNGYQLNIVVSALQKEIRRGNAELAGYWAVEMWKSGFDKYCWRRMLIISAEDCWGILTQEIKALYDSYIVLNTPRKRDRLRGGEFVAKAVLILCMAKKSRDADHLINFTYDLDMLTEGADALKASIEETMASGDLEDPADYVFDYHTVQGRSKGKDKDAFCKDEYEALSPREPGLFDHVIEKLPIFKEKQGK